ncbi:MAG: alpha/beta hydrolase [Chloroflexi bacterium]|nr:alpha/beta hydrolase [Chloroflexota bacterium]
MPSKINFALLDQPHILASAFYPRREWSDPPPGTSDYMIPVAGGSPDIAVHARLYPAEAGGSAPTILYFHGNGEVVSDYDFVSPFYSGLGLNLCVADFRGYGKSGGGPSFSALNGDAHPIFRYLMAKRREWGHTGLLFVMGRSMGAQPALELASSYPDELKGLIVESGLSDPSRMATRLAPYTDTAALEEFVRASQERLRSVRLPLLAIHGDWDEIIPYDRAVQFFSQVGSEDKRFVTIHGAGHNDLLLRGLDEYLGAIREFVFGGSGKLPSGQRG